MKYSEMKYVRPDIKRLGVQFNELVDALKSVTSFDELDSIIRQINSLRKEFESMKTIAYINYSINTENKTFEEEQDFFDNNSPVYSEYLYEYYKALVNSKFKKEITEKYGKRLIEIANSAVKVFNHEIVDDLKKENQLASKYMKLKSSARIMFEGKVMNIKEIEPYLVSVDREIRKKAFHAHWGFFSQNSKEFDRIFDELVKVRDLISKKLGYKNFVEVAYFRMQRTDYDHKMVEEFRSHIKKHIVPFAIRIRSKQKERIQIEDLKAYDLLLLFKEGNATPKGSPEWIVDNGRRMYEEISGETGEFYNFMIENDLMDVYTRKGKDSGGFCDYISKYKSPFIFANMNGTEGDITVLTHEAGHAFQAYLSRNFEVTEYMVPTMETAEIHSMSMEFITYPWMNLFFQEDTEKFKYSHLINTILFLPYGVLVDEFQHWIYENPNASPDERKKRWRELERTYMPYLDYADNEFLESGGRWQKQGHIYESPFYYIDYCLAQIVAFQFWSKAIYKQNGKFPAALKDYVELCKQGGSKSFLEIIKVVNLKSPFEENVIKTLSEEIEMYINSIDDTRL